MTPNLDFESLVTTYYSSLYQFAFSLARTETEASDLTQQTFYVWARKGHQLRDPTKVKTWLFTTLHREFLEKRRRQTRFTHHELEEVEHELPNLSSEFVQRLDTAAVLDALGHLAEAFQAPLALFYLEEHSYQEIADILEIPLGTVKSRISRGIAQLQHRLLDDAAASKGAVKTHHG